MKSIVLAGFCALAFSNAVLAIEPGPSSATQKSTEDWLQLQVSGKAASPHPQIQAPIERDLSMQRWLNNYQHPIPEFFEQNKGGSVSGGGSGGN